MRLIIYFVTNDKSVEYNQFHTIANNTAEAIKTLENKANFNFKVVGVRDYPNKFVKNFVLNSFY